MNKEKTTEDNKEKPKEQSKENTKDDEIWTAIYKWWEELKTQSGNWAALRRAKSAMEVSIQPAYFHLFTKIIKQDLNPSIKKSLDYRLPYVAGILAHIKYDEPSRKVANAMSGNTRDSEKTVSDLRFRRLLRTTEDDELYLMMIRMIRMLGDKANVKDMAQSVFFWNDRTKREWANHYYLKQDYYKDIEKENN